ncbi:MAG: hypothetical protein IT426_08665 [Pirellulales bacterium]|nr:hypothetical protein [Pirellulales bacterium]
MARENQGLQISLIVFVTLAVILGATTWLFYQKASEMEKKATELKELQEKASNAAQAKDAEVVDMCKFILGPGASGKFEDAKKQLEQDMQKYGGALNAEKQFYSPLVEKLAGILAEKNAELKAKNDEIAKWDLKYKEREASKDPQIKNFRDSSEKAAQELASAKQDFDARREEIKKIAADTEAKLATTRKEATAEIEKKKEDIGKLEKALATTKDSLEQRTTVINDLKRTIVDVPDADIRWVNQRSGLVWINVGRADGLQPLMTFAVFPADISDLSKGARKGTIEVTQLLGDHMAEARITDDTITDPIMPGDKVDTSLWNPGEQLHFALAGVMDVNGDGRSDLELVKNLITMNNGVVDSYEDDQGRVQGLSEMSINTRYLVLGGEHKQEAKVKQIAEGQAKMIDRAKELGVQSISLQELLQRMGYKSPVSTKATGTDADSSQYRAKPKSAEPRTKLPDQFQPRQPSAERSGAAS